jgi:hypothetical protein
LPSISRWNFSVGIRFTTSSAVKVPPVTCKNATEGIFTIRSESIGVRHLKEHQIIRSIYPHTLIPGIGISRTGQAFDAWVVASQASHRTQARCQVFPRRWDQNSVLVILVVRGGPPAENISLSFLNLFQSQHPALRESGEKPTAWSYADGQMSGPSARARGAHGRQMEHGRRRTQRYTNGHHWHVTAVTLPGGMPTATVGVSRPSPHVRPTWRWRAHRRWQLNSVTQTPRALTEGRRHNPCKDITTALPSAYLFSPFFPHFLPFTYFFALYFYLFVIYHIKSNSTRVLNLQKFPCQPSYGECYRGRSAGPPD